MINIIKKLVKYDILKYNSHDILKNYKKITINKKNYIINNNNINSDNLIEESKKTFNINKDQNKLNLDDVINGKVIVSEKYINDIIIIINKNNPDKYGLILKKLEIIKNLQELNIIDIEPDSDIYKYDNLYIEINEDLETKKLNLDDVINNKLKISKEYIKTTLNIVSKKNASDKLINKLKEIEKLQNLSEIDSNIFTSIDKYEYLVF